MIINRPFHLLKTIFAFLTTSIMCLIFVYQNAPSFAYLIGDYTVSKTGTVSGPANEALMAALKSKGFVAE